MVLQTQVGDLFLQLPGDRTSACNQYEHIRHTAECLRQHDEVTGPWVHTPFYPKLRLTDHLAVSLDGAFGSPGTMEVNDDGRVTQRVEHRQGVQSEVRTRQIVLRGAVRPDEVSCLQQSERQRRLIRGKGGHGR